ncbi:MAG: sulfotransferase [Gammaproteobacteria bacterium]
MRLPRPFYRLPVVFDVERLSAEVAALSPAAWVPHPNLIEGNSSVRLISVDGGDNDEVTGRMLPTASLRAAPYIRQVLASFGVAWSRSRLMRLAPGASVPLHADINHHWYSRVRMHIPVLTRPEVTFHCGDEQVHMAAGEAWLFDNWRLHRVTNPTTAERIHLVADTSGTAAFWRFAAAAGLPATQRRVHRWDPGLDAQPLTENNPPVAIMPPAEVELLLGELRGELVVAGGGDATAETLARYSLLLEEFCRDWRQLYSLSGTGRESFEQAIATLRNGSRKLGTGLVMRTNGVSAHQVLEGRLLLHVLAPTVDRWPTPSPTPVARRAAGPASEGLAAPVFIVAAPRSGSTLLFETLACHESLATLGGEAHWLVEGLPELRPGAPGVDSNRLNAAALTPAVGAQIRKAIQSRLQDAQGRPVGDRALRFLEKTPKNALRIPFFHCLFPDARFIFLWREPRANISSIIEAWRSGGFVTYGQLPGWDGPWSLLLPPQWQLQRGRPLEEIAAWQWDSANRIICDDLAAVPREQWTATSYEDLLGAAPATVQGLCAFLGLEVDAGLAARLAQPLPLSRHTQTPPAPDKWRSNAALLDRVLPGVEATRARLKRFD